MSNVELALSNFNREYEKLDTDTQIKLDDFILGIEELGYHYSEGMTFTHSEVLLNSFLPALQTICSTINVKKSNMVKGDVILELNWEPNNFIIPPDVIVRSNERYNMNLSKSEDHNFFPLVRTASGPNEVNYEDDNVYSM